MDNLNVNQGDIVASPCRKSGEITITSSSSTEELKERETYSFAIANNNKEIAMNEHIKDVLSKGRTISSYMKSLIKKDIEGDVSYKESINLDSLTQKIDNLETLIKSTQSSISFKNDDKILEKLIGLEIGVNQINLNSSKDSVILDRLTTLDTLIRNISAASLNNVSENINSSVFNKLNDVNNSLRELESNQQTKMDNLIDLVKKLTQKIEDQDDLIKNLNTTIAAQSQIIGTLNLVNNQASPTAENKANDEIINDNIDADILAKQNEAKRKSKKILKADF